MATNTMLPITLPESEYLLSKRARNFLKRWRANQITDDFYTIEEVNALAFEVIEDHNKAADAGEKHVVYADYREEQILFASTLPSEEYEDTDRFSAVRARRIRKLTNEPTIQVDDC